MKKIKVSMRCLLLCCTAIVVPVPAHADPVSLIAIVSTALSSVAAGGFTFAGVTFAAGSLGATLIAGGISLAGGLLAKALAPKPQSAVQQQQYRLPQPDPQPPYRFVYGRTQVRGQWVYHYISGESLYLGFILNSRPSESIESFEIDRRPITFLSDAENDIHDMAVGATVSEDQFNGLLRFWVGMGDQTTPPVSWITEIPNGITDKDIWTGMTILWVKMEYGDNSSARERWLAVPPDIRVVGNYSKIYDPRTSQDEDDPTTWGWSENAALCALDMARSEYGLNRLDELINFPSFVEGANACDEEVPLKAGGTEKRYRVSGAIMVGPNESEKMRMILDASAADVVDTAGLLTYVPGIWRPPVATIKDALGRKFDFSDLPETSNTPNIIRTAIISETRGWQETEIPVLRDLAAIAEDNGIEREEPFDPALAASPTQAMRLQKIKLARIRQQRSIVSHFPEEFYRLDPGDNVEVDILSPTYANGTYVVEDMAVILDGNESSVDVSISMSLGGTAESVFAWDELVDEKEFPDTVVVSNDFSGLQPPVAVSVTSGARAVGDGTNIPQAIIEITPSVSSYVVGYQIRRRESIGGLWQEISVADALETNAAGNVYIETEGVSVGVSYDFEVFSLGVGISKSTIPETVFGVTISAPNTNISPPTNGEASSTTSGEVVVSFTMPSDSEAVGITFYANDSNDEENASEIFSGSAVSDEKITYTETGIPVPDDRFYWAKSNDVWGSQSAFSASVSITLT